MCKKILNGRKPIYNDVPTYAQLVIETCIYFNNSFWYTYRKKIISYFSVEKLFSALTHGALDVVSIT